MPFPESIRQRVKERAAFTCCWCRNPLNKVDVHHIIPSAEDGPDTEENAAPLCGSCHDLYGPNPLLRKEIISRRNNWYERCANGPEYLWPIAFDVPLLEHATEMPVVENIGVHKGLRLTDRSVADPQRPPALYLTTYFRTSRYYRNGEPGHEKWLSIQADMRPAMNLRIHVRAVNRRDTQETLAFLAGANSGWVLHSYTMGRLDRSPEDVLELWRESDEKRLLISTFSPTGAGVSVHARLSTVTAQALADYLHSVGFDQWV